MCLAARSPASADAAASPAAVSGMSVRPVCLYSRLHSVSPCLITISLLIAPPAAAGPVGRRTCRSPDLSPKVRTVSRRGHSSRFGRHHLSYPGYPPGNFVMLLLAEDVSPNLPEGSPMQLSDVPSTTVLADGSSQNHGPQNHGPQNLPSEEHVPADPPSRRAARPVTERIACWSARHRVIALVGWLVMVGGAVLAGHVYGTQSQPQYDPGQSGVAERMLDRLHVVTPPSESVLIQSRTSGPRRTFAASPRMRLAASAVVAALRALPGTASDIRSPFGRAGKELIAPGGGGVLVT